MIFRVYYWAKHCWRRMPDMSVRPTHAESPRVGPDGPQTEFVTPAAWLQYLAKLVLVGWRAAA